MSGDDARQTTANAAGQRKRKWKRRRLRLPPAYFWVTLGIVVLVIAVARGTDVLRDHAVANIVTWIAVGVPLVTLLIWFWFSYAYSRRLRAVSLAATLIVIASLGVMFRIDSTSSELVPVFVWRWSRKPDELLEKPKPADLAASADSPVDLLTTTEHDFPEFLGPGRRLSVDGVKLARDWDARPPEPVWRQKIGAGWSAFSVINGFAVTMEQRGELEMVTCYKVTTGRLRWVHSTETRFEGVLAGVGPRSTPTLDEGMVYALGATGRLLCLDGATGQPLWQKDLWKEFEVTPADEEENVAYGRANSPLVVGDLLVVPAGGPAPGRCVSLAAFDKKTGSLVWKGGRRQVAYSSPVLATLGGAQQILIVNQDWLSGHDPATGKVLWEQKWPGNSSSNANVSQAVPIPPGRVFVSKGYLKGAMLLELSARPDGTFDTKEIWASSRVMRTKFTNVVLHQGHVYGLSDGILECVELDTGRRKWKHGRYGHGQILRVGGLLLVLSESGELLLVEATPERHNHVLGKIQALDGMTWNNLALYGPYLLVRNAQQAGCYRLPLDE